MKLVIGFIGLTLLVACSQAPKVSAQREVAQTTTRWWAAQEADVTNAKCRVPLPLSSPEIKDFYNNQTIVEKEESIVEVYGLKIKNQRLHLVNALKDLLVPDALNPPPKSKQLPSNLNTKFKIPATCTDVFCLSEIIFGKEVGPQMLFILDKYDLNTSAYVFNDAQMFRAEELKDIIRSLELLPESLNIFQFNKKLIRYTQGKRRPNSTPNVVANSAMELFDPWEKYNSAMRQYILFHEYAHNLALSQLINFDTSARWLNISGWKYDQDRFIIDRNKIMAGHDIISGYGKSSPFEDFAESMTAYRFDPHHLKKVSPDKYHFLKILIFDGLEFTSAKNCNRPQNISQYQSDINNNKYPLSTKELFDVYVACRNQFYRSAFANDPYSNYKACINFESATRWFPKAQNNYSNLIPHSILDVKLGISSLQFSNYIAGGNKSYSKDTARWITQELMKKKVFFKGINSQEAYCKVWEEIKNTSFEEKGVISGWDALSFNKSAAKKPSLSGLKMICHESLKMYKPFPDKYGRIDKEKLYQSIHQALSKRMK